MFVIKYETVEGDNLYVSLIEKMQWRSVYGLKDALRFDTREQAEAAISPALDMRRHGYEVVELVEADNAQVSQA